MWESDIFIPVSEKNREQTLLNDFFKKRSFFYIPSHYPDAITEKLVEHRRLLVRGAPGSGKTCLCLHWALSRPSVTPEREIKPLLYYINTRSLTGKDPLIQGIKQRCSAPAVFILDDIHRNPEMIFNALQPLGDFLAGKPHISLICLERTVLRAGEEHRADNQELMDFFNDNTLEVQTDEIWFSGAAKQRRPNLYLRGRELFDFCGGDLFMLDAVLEHVAAAEEWEQHRQNRRSFYEKLIKKYFNTGAGNFKSLLVAAAPAMYDIVLEDKYYNRVKQEETNPRMRVGLETLIAGMGRPVKHYFQHTSQAELFARAAAYMAGKDFVEAVSPVIAGYLANCAQQGSGGEFDEAVAALTNNRLKLGEAEDRLVKKKVLGDPGVTAAIRDRFEELPPNLLPRIAAVLDGDPPRLSAFMNLIREKVMDDGYFERLIKFPPNKAHAFYLWLANDHPGVQELLNKRFTPDTIGERRQRLDFPTFVFLANMLSTGGAPAVMERWQEILTALDRKDCMRMLANCGANVSLDAVHNNLRFLEKRDLLPLLEKKICVRGYLTLLQTNGSFIELIRFLQYSTPAMAGQLIAAITPQWLSGLVEQTIRQNRPQIHLKWGIVLLLKRCGGLNETFEQTIGLDNIFRLLFALGDPGDLSGVLEVLPEPGRRRLEEAWKATPPESTTALIMRGHFYNLVHFITAPTPLTAHFPLPTLDDSHVNRLLDSSDLQSIMGGVEQLAEARPGDPLRDRLLNSAATFLSRISQEFPADASFGDTVYLAAALHRLKQQDPPFFRRMLAQRDLRLLNREEAPLKALSVLLSLLTQLPALTGEREFWLAAAHSPHIPPLVQKANPLHLFLFLWNAFALQAETAGDLSPYRLNPEPPRAVLTVLSRYKKANSYYPEYKFNLAIIGLLEWLGFEQTEIRAVYPADFKVCLNRDFLQSTVTNNSFLIAYFFLKGNEFFMKGKKIYDAFYDLLAPQLEKLTPNSQAFNRLITEYRSRRTC